MAPQLIPAQISIRPDGLVTATVGGAVLRDASAVPMDQAKTILTRYSAAFGPLLVTAAYHDGRRQQAVLTPEHGMQPYRAPAPQPVPAPVFQPAYAQPAPSPPAYAQPAIVQQHGYYQGPGAGVPDELEDLARHVESLPPARHTAVRGPAMPRYRAPGLEQLAESLHGPEFDMNPDPFAGVVPGAPHLRAGALVPGTPGNWISENDVPDVNIEEDIRQSLASGKGSSSRRIPRIPIKALKSAAVVGTLFSILAGLMIAKPWVQEAPAERPDRTVFEQLETGELQGG